MLLKTMFLVIFGILIEINFHEITFLIDIFFKIGKYMK